MTPGTQGRKERREEGREIPQKGILLLSLRADPALPDDIKKEEISASMEHGVLNITLPKNTETPAAPKERFIDIK